MILDIPFPLLTYIYEEAPLIARFERTLVRVTSVVEFEKPKMFTKSIG